MPLKIHCMYICDVCRSSTCGWSSSLAEHVDGLPEGWRMLKYNHPAKMHFANQPPDKVLWVCNDKCFSEAKTLTDRWACGKEDWRAA